MVILSLLKRFLDITVLSLEYLGRIGHALRDIAAAFPSMPSDLLDWVVHACSAIATRVSDLF